MDFDKLYNYLWGLNSSLVHSTVNTNINDHSWERYHSVLDELMKLTGDDLFLEYKVRVIPTHYKGSRPRTVYSVLKDEFQRKVYQATFYLYKNYEGNLDEPKPPEALGVGDGLQPAAVVHQTQHNTQRTELSVEFHQTLMNLTEQLVKGEVDYPDEKSKENRFIRKLKELLPLAKSSVEIIATVLRVAKEYGIDPGDALKILKLG
jgi:hypothetical protein